MEEFVVSDLCESKDIESVALLDGDGFVRAIEPNQEKNNHLMSQLGNNLNNLNEFESTTLITDKHIILVQKLIRNYTLIAFCLAKCNLGAIRHQISVATDRLNAYLKASSR